MMRRGLLLVLSAALAAACSGPILANSPAPTGAPYEKPTPRPSAIDPIAVSLPADDAPHDRLTEWWYVTGHLTTLDGAREFGYEAVVFRAKRGQFPVSWASMLVLPDGGMEIGGNGLMLQLGAGRAPVLHDTDGWVAFADAGGSYYYSRTRMPTGGTLTVGGETFAVTGSSWFDHQWGDFIAIGGGGWDWFALNLSDGSDLMLSFVRAKDGTFPLVYGTWVEVGGEVRHIEGGEISLTALGSWTSPRSGATWPSGWRVQIAQIGLDVTVTPELADQELNTLETTGVIYWEGANSVVGTLAGRPISGRSYVELTGYATLR
ncbi:hypothetical protein EBU60_05495 [bacterium]|nr:hypothetical protein [bacterium]